MCLDKVTKVTNLKDEVTAYKAVSIYDNKYAPMYQGTCGARFPVGEWLSASSFADVGRRRRLNVTWHTQYDWKSTTYLAGFHAFRTRSDAERYASRQREDGPMIAVVKVKMRKLTALGYQKKYYGESKDYACIVAEKMFIESEV